MQFNRFSRAGVCLSAALICTPINAQETFRSEIFFLHSSSEFDSLDGKSNVLAGTYFFSPVNTGNGPLAESRFLSRSSAISAVVSNSELSGPFGTSQYDSDSSRYGLVLEIRDLSTANTVSAGFTRNQTDQQPAQYHSRWNNYCLRVWTLSQRQSSRWSEIFKGQISWLTRRLGWRLHLLSCIKIRQNH